MQYILHLRHEIIWVVYVREFQYRTLNTFPGTPHLPPFASPARRHFSIVTARRRGGEEGGRPGCWGRGDSEAPVKKVPAKKKPVRKVVPAK